MSATANEERKPVATPDDVARETKKKEAFRIIHKSAEMVVVDKPHNVAMDGEYEPHVATVERWVYSELKDFLAEPLPSSNQRQRGGGNKGPTEKQLKYVHQLDYATSGLLCLSFSRLMASQLGHCFQMRYTKKEYLALLVGHLDVDEVVAKFPEVTERCRIGSSFEDEQTEETNKKSELVEEKKEDCQAAQEEAADDEKKEETTAAVVHGLQINLPVGYDEEDPNKFKMKVNWDEKLGKKSRTELQVLSHGYLKTKDGKGTELPVTKVLLLPASGRRHQLRVHTSYLGHPIVGDWTYCTDKVNYVETVDRMMLHAYQITFRETFDDAENVTHLDRYKEKRKRRREKLGIEERMSQAKTVFSTERDPFSMYVVDGADYAPLSA